MSEAPTLYGRTTRERVFETRLAGTAGGTLYAAVPNGEVRYSDDGGKRWRR